jgi:hypothetical protein
VVDVGDLVAGELLGDGAILGPFHGVRGTSCNAAYDRWWQTLLIVPPATPIDRAWFGGAAQPEHAAQSARGVFDFPQHLGRRSLAERT